MIPEGDIDRFTDVDEHLEHGGDGYSFGVYEFNAFDAVRCCRGVHMEPFTTRSSVPVVVTRGVHDRKVFVDRGSSTP